ncbi:ankyrin repeat domain-containing protein [Halocynthiibacter sp.]|uniref:ankyrin repeat domain-containing protein n=1 Tax=Halocynthiibacter sp. TaxID=1979210 RepID=UPI003C516452
MNTLELHARLQAEERAVQDALRDHNLQSRYQEYRDKQLDRFLPILRDAIKLPDDELCPVLHQHLAAGEDIEASPRGYGMTAVKRCFYDGKLAAMRLLIRAGARTNWTKDQVAIALGDAPIDPDTKGLDPFLFACRVGNLDAVKAYAAASPVYKNRADEALIDCVQSRAVLIVAWLLAEGFSPNASTKHGSSALKYAAENDDIETADLLLKAGATPYGQSENEFMSAAAMATTDRMRRVFVQNGVHPAYFNYALNPEAPEMGFLPEIPLTQKDFETNRSARPGTHNPERFLPAFWQEQMRSCRYAAPKDMPHERDRTKPIWSVQRYGRTATRLPDGRLVLIAGEHEDGYDPDFCIYADVTVLDGRGGLDHYIYPADVFPPTDFHTASLVGDHIWLIGSLGYPEDLKVGFTQVLRLSLDDFSVQPIETTGDHPDWINSHKAILCETGIMIMGGKVGRDYRDNKDVYMLDLNTLEWTKHPPASCKGLIAYPS